MQKTILEVAKMIETLNQKIIEDSRISFKFTYLHELEKLEELENLPWRYSLSAQKYYSAYFQNDKSIIENLVLTIFQGNHLIGITAISITKIDRMITSNGEAVLLPFLVDTITFLAREYIMNLFIDLILQIKKAFNLQSPVFQTYSVNLLPSISERLLEISKRVVEREVYLKDCRGDQSELWTGIRKSYKSKINKGLREVTHGILTGQEASVLFDSFKQLHLEVSGHKTRSDITWQIQKSEVLNKSAFLTFTKIGEELIGCSFVSHTRYSAIYGVGVYKRELLDMNLGHISQWISIQQLNRIGVREYRLGHLEMDCNMPYSSKELSIANFKKGFATEIKYEYLYFL